MSDEDIILNVHALTNEGVTRDFAVLPYGRTFLNLNKGTNLGTIVNTASVSVYEVKNAHVLANLDVVEGLLVVVDRDSFHNSE